MSFNSKWSRLLGRGQLKQKREDDKKKERVKCSVCHQSFAKASGLATHMKKHRKLLPNLDDDDEKKEEVMSGDEEIPMDSDPESDPEDYE